MGTARGWHKLESLPHNMREKFSELGRFFEVEGVLIAYLFGSFSKKDKPEDIDIAVLSHSDITELREKLWEILGTQRLDLVDLGKASPLLRFEIVRSGTILYKRNDDIENTFEMRTLKEYKDTSHLRKRQKKILLERTKKWYYSQR